MTEEALPTSHEWVRWLSGADATVLLESRESLGIMPLQASPQPQGPCPDPST